jgi:hypothetical protein
MKRIGVFVLAGLFLVGIVAFALRWLWIAMIAVAVLLFAYSAARTENLIEPTAAEAADIATWIPAFCCRTNNCCRKVHESALLALPNNRIRVRATGQEIPRTGWSQDRNTWRCACDPQPDGSWRVHPQAHTRCVFDHPAVY